MESSKQLKRKSLSTDVKKEKKSKKLKSANEEDETNVDQNFHLPISTCFKNCQPLDETKISEEGNVKEDIANEQKDKKKKKKNLDIH